MVNEADYRAKKHGWLRSSVSEAEDKPKNVLDKRSYVLIKNLLAAGYKQKQVAEWAGIAPSYISHMVSLLDKNTSSHYQNDIDTTTRGPPP